MQTILQALQNITSALIIIASPILIIALIVAGFNMASSDGGKQEKAKRQLIGITIAAILIYGSAAIVPWVISLVPGGTTF